MTLSRMTIAHHDGNLKPLPLFQAFESIYTIATSSDYQKENIYGKISQSIAAILEAPVVSTGKVLNNAACAHSCYIRENSGHSSDTTKCALCKIVLSSRTVCQISGDLGGLYPGGACLASGYIKTSLGVPVLSRSGEITGIICVLDMKERRFSDEQMQLLEIFARYISNEIEKEMFVKEMVQAREMALLGKLTSGIVHEVRNPLNAIWAIAEALFLDISGNEANLVYKEHIRSQVQRLSRLMQDLQDLGKPHFRNDPFPLSGLCSETIGLWTCNNAGSSHKILYNMDTDKDHFIIKGDSAQMQQALMNLLDNASGHSPAGSAISVEIGQPEPRYVCITIRDEGSGIAPSIKSRIFDPFFTTRKGGTGLGLSIVKHIVESHNGTISLENNDPPPGLTVRIRLPLVKDVS